MSKAPALSTTPPGILGRWLTGRESLIVWLVAAGAIAMGIAIIVQRHAVTGAKIFWDLPVYVAAAQAYELGLDPYDPAVLVSLGVRPDFYFTSPPTVAILFRLAGEANLTSLVGPVLLTAHFIAFFTLPLALGRLFFGRAPERLLLATAAMVMLYMYAGVFAFAAANNGTVLYCAIAASLIRGFEKDRWTPFLVAVLIATLFKPFYLAFLAIPVLARGFSWRLAVAGAVTGLVALGVYALFALFDPGTFGRWLARLSAQTIEVGYAGQNIYGGLLELKPSAPRGVLGAVQLVFTTVLAAAFLLIAPRGRLRWAFLLALVIYVNPRVLTYDFSIAAIPLAFAASTLLPRTLEEGTRLALSVAALTMVLLVPVHWRIGLLPEGLLFPMATLVIMTSAALVQRHRIRSRDPSAGAAAET
jgi:hypothetical protein